MTALLLLTAGIFLPLYPLSALPNAWLQGRAKSASRTPLAEGPAAERAGRGRVWLEASLLVLLPLIGVGLVRLALADQDPAQISLLPWLAVWGGLTSVLYAFRLLSAKDGQIWIAHLYTSALALIWVGIAYGLDPLLPALGLSVSLLPLLFLLEQLTRRFGIARSGLYPGLCAAMPVFGHLFIAAVLTAIAVPFSPSFFAIAALAFGGVAAHALIVLLPLGLSWLLWSWAGVNLLNGIVWGAPRDDLVYRDLAQRPAWTLAGAMLALGVFGIVLVEIAL